MKKTWISVKRGLVRDNKHRVAMGESVWLFLYMLDVVDWDSGVINDWKDEAAAEDMQMPVRTLREQRRKLAELDYIVCNQKQYSQSIVINNWTNPREYSGETYNKKQGGNKASPEQKAQGDTQDYTQDYTQGSTQGSTQDVTPTYDSKNQISGKKSKISLPAGSDLGFALAAGMTSAEIAAAAEKDLAEQATANAWESAMGYNPLSWWSDDDLKKLLRFLMDKTPADMQKFAEWSKRGYSTFDPVKAKRYPLEVITFWKIAVPETIQTAVKRDSDGIPETY